MYQSSEIIDIYFVHVEHFLSKQPYMQIYMNIWDSSMMEDIGTRLEDCYQKRYKVYHF